ncbi:hypothetical protein AB0I60_01795 [Actinosynnema sp. NPDC050436]|uniref:hypothetical protein n=1 Tax=Actinosynnema sp. NPDC050436 TaxID=3155659 RepID=UPI0033CAFCC2
MHSELPVCFHRRVDWPQVTDGVAPPGATVSVVARNPLQLDLVTVDPGGNARTTWGNLAERWHAWIPGPGGTAAPGATVTAVARYADHLDVFASDHGVVRWAPWQEDATGSRSWADL